MGSIDISDGSQPHTYRKAMLPQALLSARERPERR
jgi:hypothetical protein